MRVYILVGGNPTVAPVIDGSENDFIIKYAPLSKVENIKDLLSISEKVYSILITSFYISLFMIGLYLLIYFFNIFIARSPGTTPLYFFIISPIKPDIDTPLFLLTRSFMNDSTSDKLVI